MQALALNARWLVFVVALVVIDQWTKEIAQAHLLRHVPYMVTTFFNLTLTFNTGAAFSFLSDSGGWQRWLFVGIASVVSVILVVWLLRLPSGGTRWLPFALSLVLGGALGNLWDRIVLGAVVDFLDFHWNDHHWPAFNFADTVITVGAGLLIVLTLTEDTTTDQKE